MNELLNKITNWSEGLNLKFIGLIASAVVSIASVILYMTNMIDAMSTPVTIAYVVVGLITTILAGSFRTTSKMALAAFNWFTIIFPYYFLDILAGGIVGILALMLMGMLPIVPVIINKITL